MVLLFPFEGPLNMVSQWEPEAINLGFSFSAIVAVLRHLINQTCYVFCQSSTRCVLIFPITCRELCLGFIIYTVYKETGFNLG